MNYLKDEAMNPMSSFVVLVVFVVFDTIVPARMTSDAEEFASAMA